jgi:hypothetical protein
MKPQTKNKLKRAGVIVAGSFLLTLAGVVFMAFASIVVHFFGWVGSFLL